MVTLTEELRRQKELAFLAPIPLLRREQRIIWWALLGCL